MQRTQIITQIFLYLILFWVKLIQILMKCVNFRVNSDTSFKNFKSELSLKLFFPLLLLKFFNLLNLKFSFFVIKSVLCFEETIFSIRCDFLDSWEEHGIILSWKNFLFDENIGWSSIVFGLIFWLRCCRMFFLFTFFLLIYDFDILLILFDEWVWISEYWKKFKESLRFRFIFTCGLNVAVTNKRFDSIVEGLVF